MKVTLLELHLAGACKEQKRLFKQTFGRKAEINKENLEKAVEAGLDVSFYGKYLDTLYNKSRRKAVMALWYEYDFRKWEEQLEKRMLALAASEEQH